MADGVAIAIVIAALSLPLSFGLGLIAPVRIDVEPRSRRGFGRMVTPRLWPSADGLAVAEAASPAVEKVREAELEPVAG
jgi:hypothetical protein